MLKDLEAKSGEEGRSSSNCSSKILKYRLTLNYYCLIDFLEFFEKIYKSLFERGRKQNLLGSSKGF